MRLSYPTIRSQRVLWRSNFRNISEVIGTGGYISGSVSVEDGLDLSSGGYVRYQSYGAGSLSTLPYWTIFAEIVVPSSGSQRVVLSNGHTGVGDRFEIGLDSSNNMYMTGTSTVTSDDALSTGTHKCLWIYSGSVVDFYVDGVRIGSSSVTLGSYFPPSVYIGVDSDGSSNKFGSTVLKLDIYNYPLDESDAFGVSAIEGWTPRSLLTDYGGTYDNGFYLDGDEAGTYGLNDQPDQLNVGSLTGWSGYGGTLSLGTDYVRMTSTAASDNTLQTNVRGIVGNRYTCENVRWRKSGGTRVIAYFGSGASASVAASFIDGEWVDSGPVETTWVGDTINRVLHIGATIGSKLDFSQLKNLINRSCKRLNIYGSGTLAGSKFEQANDANMPWKSSDGLGVRFDGVGDYADLTAPLLSLPIHVFLLGTSSSKVNQSLIDSVAGNECRIYEDIASRFRLYSGSAGPAIAYTPGSPFVIDAVFNGASSKIGIDGGVQQVGDAGSDGAAGFRLAADGGSISAYSDLVSRKVFLVQGELGATERAMVCNYLMRAAR